MPTTTTCPSMAAARCWGRCRSAASGRRRRAPKRAETKTEESERGVRLGQEGQLRLAAFAAEDGVAVGEAADAGDDVAVPLGIEHELATVQPPGQEAHDDTTVSQVYTVPQRKHAQNRQYG